jgi:eukaryotic-like serine/threonine-protein kinase
LYESFQDDFSSKHNEGTMATTNPNRPCISFGAFELDLQVGELRKHGIRMRCQEQPLQVLAALAKRPGELVTREELRRRVWSQDTFVDFDHALNTAIKKLRATLSDDADAPRYIETVPRRGYRFIATLQPPPQEAPAPPLPAPALESSRKRWFVIPGALGSILLLGLAGIVLTWRHSEASSSPEFQRLTFEQPEIGDARFTPDGVSVVYSVAGQSKKADIYMQRLSAPSPHPQDLLGAELLAVSRQGELAVLGGSARPEFDAPHRDETGTLARVSLGGSAPRELLPEVEAADWSPDGQLAVVRRVADKSRLEFPIGRTLYESAGWIASPRFSPNGDAIAFLDHPIVPDDRGAVMMVDLKGGKKVLSGVWESARGLSWNARGDEIWFAAARSGVSRALYAVTVSGRERRVLSMAGGVSLRDIAADGRVLLTRDNERLGILYRAAGATEFRDLSWKDWSLAMDISRDGKQILFGEEGENSGSSYEVGLRPTDGSGPVILGPGAAQSLSPDGKWALSIMPPPDEHVLLLPTGVGATKSLERGNVEHYAFFGAKWLPDAKHIVFVAYEANHGWRCYMQSIEGGRPKPFTADGAASCSVSPAGSVLEITEDHRALLYPSVSSQNPQKEFRIEEGQMPVGWSPDGKFLYLLQSDRGSIKVVRLEIATGRRQPWKQMARPPENLEVKCEHVLVAPDGQSYAYTYSYHASDLYLVQGLR